MRVEIIRLIDNVHMGLGHDGLAKLCKEKFKLHLDKIPDGQLVMFLNRGRDKLKIMGGQGKVLGYIRMPHEQKLMLDAVSYLPQTFGSGGFSYDEALKKALSDRLARRATTLSVSPLVAYRAAASAGVA